MPCDTIALSTVKFSMEKTDLTLFKAAMASLGFSLLSEKNGVLVFSRGSESLTFNNGKVTVRVVGDEQEVMSQVKVAYSRQVVNKVAKRQGWALSEKSPNKFLAQKRSM